MVKVHFENVFCNLELRTGDFENLISSWPDYIGSICVSFSTSLFSGSGDIMFTRSLWPSPADLDL